MTTLVSSSTIDFRYFLPDVKTGADVLRTDSSIQYSFGGYSQAYLISGSGLTSSNGVATSITHTSMTTVGGIRVPVTQWQISDFSTAAQPFVTALESRDPLALTQLILGGDDSLTGAGGDDYVWGLSGDDSIQGGGGNDTLGGDDGEDWVRGGQGNDFIHGGAAFDDLHGNEGNDTVSGRDGDDWVVGGKDDDLLSGDEGGDIVYGNLGNDTCDGGVGADIVRGGQGDDSVSGGDGADFIAGDLGADTVSGGLGADIFHTHATAGLDRVTDFNAGEGDRVNLLPGTAYSLSQQGADTVIDMGGGNMMVLVNVNLASLPAGWIFGAD